MTDEEYVQKKLREHPYEKENPWKTEAQPTRVFAATGMAGKNDSWNTTQLPNPPPVQNGNSTGTGAGDGALGPIPDVIIDMNGTLYYMDLNAAITGPV